MKTSNFIQYNTITNTTLLPRKNTNMAVADKFGVGTILAKKLSIEIWEVKDIWNTKYKILVCFIEATNHCAT